MDTQSTASVALVVHLTGEYCTLKESSAVDGAARLINAAMTLRTLDGEAELFVRKYVPIRRDNGCTLVVIHGAGEHGGRYGHFIEQVVHAGWTVIAGDLRGHGRSGGVPTHLDRFEQYLEDLDLIWSHFQLHPQTTAVFAHSMGGLVAIRFAQTRKERMAALALSAPLLGLRVRVKMLKRAVGKLCSVVRPTTRFRTEVKMSHITRNDEVLDNRELDPWIQRSVTAGWFFQVQQAVTAAHLEAVNFDVPLLFLQGDADEVVNHEMANDWLEQIASTDCTKRIMPEHFHEIINEPGWERTTQEILKWFHPRMTPATPSRRAA
ncbi:MAG: lysophospholipase [Planctomycetaceae bacterium]|nr:lysophospholipase [Planctomycetaceae bacterium]